MAFSEPRQQMGQQPMRPDNPEPVDFGPNVIIFDDSQTDIEIRTGNVLATQKSNQFGTARTAFFFKPGIYNNLTVEIGYYTTVHGLGALPDDVTIKGGVTSVGFADDGTGSALNNFWRGVENLKIEPAGGINLFAVSQATFMRRVHISGRLFLWDFNFDQPDPKNNRNFSSGGFIADSVVDAEIISGSQQQFLTRNTNVTNFIGGVWNMVFVGDQNSPSEGLTWGTFDPTVPDKKPLTVIERTPVIREKPYLTIGSDGSYSVQVPALARNTQGPTWSGLQPAATTSVPIKKFYIAKPAPNNADNAVILNQKLHAGYHLILTPGIYPLAHSLQVSHPGTIILGIGLATLTPTGRTAAMEIADVDGVTVSGILFDAGPENSRSILVVSPHGSHADHSANPTAIFDVSCRVGGSAVARAENCFMINSNDVIMDNVWIWRADHGSQPSFVGWNINPSRNGLTVNGNRVTAYGLFVEHFKEVQTIWNGEQGSTYFYQSEIPYDVPSQAAWLGPNGEKGFPSYKVSDHVTKHTAKGLGVYSNFQSSPDVQLENAIETPSGPGIDMYHMVTVWLDGEQPLSTNTSSINHVLNGKGGQVSEASGGPKAPAFLASNH